eukprot:c24045_g1_i5 orf=151-1824(+)
MLLSKHVWRSRRRGGVLVACCSKSTGTSCFHLLPSPHQPLAGSNGSFAKAFHSEHELDAPSSSPSSSSRPLLQTIQDVGVLHLHQQATPQYVSDGTSSIKSKSNGGDEHGLPRARRCKASSVSQTVGDMCSGSPLPNCKPGSHQRDEPPSVMLISSFQQDKEHVGAHRQRRSRKDEGTLRNHQSITQSYTAPLGNLEDMCAVHLPQHDGKNEQAPLLGRKDKRSLKKQTAEYWGAFLRRHGFLPASIFNIVKTVPVCKRTQVHFENIVSLVLLLQTMGIDRDLIPVIIKKAPFMYQRNPVLHLEPKIAYLEMLGLQRTEMRRLVLHYPHALRPPIEDIQAQIQFLRAIPLQHEDVLTILHKNPLVFRLPVDKYVRPKLEFFRSLGTSETDIRKMLVGYPRLFCARLCRLQKFVCFVEGLGLQPGTTKFSWSLMMWKTYDVEVLQSRLQSLSNAGLSPQEVKSLAARAPSILAKSTQHITEKLNYLADVMKRSAREVVKYPAFLGGHSLDKRIRPRHEAFVQWTAEKQVNKHFSLSYIFKCTDKALSIRFPGIVVKKS